MEGEQRSRPSIWILPATIGIVGALSLLTLGAMDVWECYRLGWLQRSAAHAVIEADAIRAKAESDQLKGIEETFKIQNNKKR